MKSMAVVMMTVATTVSACGSDGPSVQECPRMAGEFRALIGENGNPAPESLPRLSARWDAAYHELGTLRKASQGQACRERLPVLRREVQGIEDLGYGLQDVDPAEDVGGPQAVRNDLVKNGVTDGKKFRQADDVDRLLPAAAAVLEPAFEKADRTNPRDRSAVRATVKHVKQLANKDPAVTTWLTAVETLDVFEYFDEPS